jgi:metal-responsive CopG/Arc/MetJ family transcriptional regulator
MRTIIDLPDEQIQALAAWCERENLSRAEAIRRALASMLTTQKKEGRAAAFGGWKARTQDSRKLVDALRGEWNS